MTKFWTYFKKVVLVWGFISLAFFLVAVVSLTMSSYSSRQRIAEIEEDDKFNKTVGDVEVTVTRKYDSTNTFFVNVTKAKKPLITNYELPTKRFDLNWIKVTDASVVPINDKEYRIILYSAVYDCDQESGHYIWFLKLDSKMTLVKMIALSDVHKANDSESLLFGSKIISLPSFTDFKYENIIVPIEVGIKETIRTAPMLNQRSIDIMKHYYGAEIDKRIAKLTASSETETLKQYKKAADEFTEVLSERTYPY